MENGHENLIPASERSLDEVRENARKGGIKSGETRRAKKTMKDIISVILDMPVKGGKKTTVDEIKSLDKLNGKNLSVQEMIILAQVKNALKGDRGAIEFLRDTSGQSVSNKID